MNITKSPSECNSKKEIRMQIDQIDKEIISLFALRFQYVCEIVKFKSDAESIVALNRKNEVIELRGEWAENLGLDNHTFKQIYKLLIEHNIKKEMEILHENLNQQHIT